MTSLPACSEGAGPGCLRPPPPENGVGAGLRAGGGARRTSLWRFFWLRGSVALAARASFPAQGGVCQVSWALEMFSAGKGGQVHLWILTKCAPKWGDGWGERALWTLRLRPLGPAPFLDPPLSRPTALPVPLRTGTGPFQKLLSLGRPGKRCFSNFNIHTDHLGTLLKCSLDSRVGSDILRF